jgi:tRNA (guanine10-N2)-dimethyltransferase
MTHTYRLAGEDLNLAEADLAGCLAAEGKGGIRNREGRVALAPRLERPRRLARSHEVSEVVYRGGIEGIDISPETSFAVRSPDGLEKPVGKQLSGPENTVDLENPDEIYRAYGTKEELVLGRQVADIDRGLFEKRVNQNREFSSPVSMSPVLARTLVNLSQVSVGETLFDPFCGTGGVLIEAGLCGIKPAGADIKGEMVKGTKENLEQLGVLNHNIHESAARHASHKVDYEVVVTDLPYGKSSEVEGDAIDQLLEAAEDAGRTVFVSDKDSVRGMEPTFSVYIHGSLTRHVYVLH